jgi:hypothetical protein
MCKVAAFQSEEQLYATVSLLPYASLEELDFSSLKLVGTRQHLHSARQFVAFAYKELSTHSYHLLHPAKHSQCFHVVVLTSSVFSVLVCRVVAGRLVHTAGSLQQVQESAGPQPQRL